MIQHVHNNIFQSMQHKIVRISIQIFSKTALQFNPNKFSAKYHSKFKNLFVSIQINSIQFETFHFNSNKFNLIQFNAIQFKVSFKNSKETTVHPKIPEIIWK